MENSSNKKSGKHLYNRGWLGLIPLIGGFAGIYLLLLGVIKYKDRKLILIGCADILFTVLIYSSIFYYFFFSESGRKGFAGLTQDELNYLVSDIEFYKLQNNQYPDSLEQILIYNKHAIIEDYFSNKGFEEKKNFHYEKTGSHYTLFSVGLDMIPYTKDDIYPSVDTIKTGLIKPY